MRSQDGDRVFAHPFELQSTRGYLMVREIQQRRACDQEELLLSLASENSSVRLALGSNSILNPKKLADDCKRLTNIQTFKFTQLDHDLMSKTAFVLRKIRKRSEVV